MREEIIRIKLKEIKDSLTKIKNNLPKTLEEFLDLGLIKDGIYKRVEFMIENVLDICKIINTDLNLGLPKKDVDIIENLMKHKIISKKMGIFLCKKFNNIFKNFIISYPILKIFLILSKKLSFFTTSPIIFVAKELKAATDLAFLL